MSRCPRPTYAQSRAHTLEPASVDVQRYLVERTRRRAIIILAQRQTVLPGRFNEKDAALLQ